jgi:hypothetical protein
MRKVLNHPVPGLASLSNSDPARWPFSCTAGCPLENLILNADAQKRVTALEALVANLKRHSERLAQLECDAERQSTRWEELRRRTLPFAE